LKLNGDADLDMYRSKLRSIENVDMTDGAADDAVGVSMDLADRMSGTDILKITGDAGDEVDNFAHAGRLDDVEIDGLTFAVFNGFDGEQILVQHGLNIGGEAVAAKVDVPHTPVENAVDADVTFVGETAGYKNTVGFYVVDDAGNITQTGLLFENASLKGSGGDLLLQTYQLQG